MRNLPSASLAVAFAAAFIVTAALADPMSAEYRRLWGPEVQKEIDARIERCRKADASFGGFPSGVTVVVEQVSHDFKFGAHIFDFDQLGSDEANDAYKATFTNLLNAATVAYYWGSYEPEKDGGFRHAPGPHDNAAFWNSVAALSPKEKYERFIEYRRPAPDPILDFCGKNGVDAHGHVMIYRGYHPEWVEASGVSDADILAAYRRHIRELAAHCGTRVSQWDVVNESVRRNASVDAPDDAVFWEDPSRRVPPDYTLACYDEAAKCLPAGVRTVINEACTVDDVYLAFVKSLMDRGAKIDVVGLQFHIFKAQEMVDLAHGAHHGRRGYDYTPERIMRTLANADKLGRPIHISEITVPAPEESPWGEAVQAEALRDLYRLWFSWPSVYRITYWNLVDFTSSKESLSSGFFRRDMSRKPVYDALDNLINHEWRTRLNAVADGQGKISFRGFRGKYRLSWKDSAGMSQSRIVDVPCSMQAEPSGFAPCSIVAMGDGFTNRLVRTESGWSDGAVTVSVDGDGSVSVRSPGKGLSSVSLSWRREWPGGALFLNDAWERSYGELEWRPLSGSEIVSPWYFLSTADGKTSGIGVETQPNALACWKIGKHGFSLTLDVRAGGRPVRLGNRVLRACRIVRSESTAGESAWQFGRRFCRTMCPRPRLPKTPVYGYNDWYCACGKNTATNFLADAEYVVSCAKGCDNPPYVVMDDGWQKNSPPVVGESGRGPWDAAGPNFGMDMPKFCRAIAALGAKPGLWYRPLRAWDELPEGQRLLANGKYLDPTVPSVRSRIVEDVRRFREWGFKLVKIDFLSYDIAQLWPCDPRPFPELFIQDDRAWRDDSRTTAEVMLDLYRAMKDAAGDDVVIIGCNALNHLAAGVFELQRIGDDTSGKDWNRTRRCGVNTLAMRSIQDGAFFKVDADCVGLASEGAVPWTLNRQWMELLGKSGTPMFVSWRRELATPEVRTVLSEMFKLASSARETAEPLDWFETRQPRHWRFVDNTAEKYDWQLHDTNPDKESKTLPVKDVSYVAEGDAYRLARCKLDLRIPAETGFPTVVWFHGGGLTGGGRHFLEIDRKIGIVAVDYRLMNATNGVQGADCIEDAAAAVAWTLKNIAAYGGDAKKVYVSGMSAGGYLTMMVGMAPAYLAKHGFKLTDLAGIVPISGQATKHFAVRKFAGDKDPQFLPKIDELAPLQWVGADLPPILDVCGQPPYEWKCRSEENRLLVASCVALGHTNARFVECPFCDHGRVFRAALPYLEFFVLGRMP